MRGYSREGCQVTNAHCLGEGKVGVQRLFQPQLLELRMLWNLPKEQSDENKPLVDNDSETLSHYRGLQMDIKQFGSATCISRHAVFLQLHCSACQ